MQKKSHRSDFIITVSVSHNQSTLHYKCFPPEMPSKVLEPWLYLYSKICGEKLGDVCAPLLHAIVVMESICFKKKLKGHMIIMGTEVFFFIPFTCSVAVSKLLNIETGLKQFYNSSSPIYAFLSY